MNCDEIPKIQGRFFHHRFTTKEVDGLLETNGLHFMFL